MSSGEPIFIEDGAAERFMVWPDGTARGLEFKDDSDLDFSRRLGEGTASEFAEIEAHGDGKVELLRIVPCEACEDGAADYERLDAYLSRRGVTACKECGGYREVLDFARELVDLGEFVSAGVAA